MGIEGVYSPSLRGRACAKSREEMDMRAMASSRCQSIWFPTAFSSPSKRYSTIGFRFIRVCLHENNNGCRRQILSLRLWEAIDTRMGLEIPRNGNHADTKRHFSADGTSDTAHRTKLYGLPI